MNMKLELSELINQQGIVPLYYSADAEVSIDLMRALYAGGIRTTEYADRGDRALKNFREMRKVCDAELPGMRLGIGTIKTAESARIYIDEGAEFLVCPGILESVIEISDRYGLLCIPGCMTPSEIIRAESCGSKIVKLFPANTLGPSYIEAVQALFQDIVFLPTGGIELNEDNLRKWFKVGVCAVGGSKMITKDVIENKRYDQLSAESKRSLNLIRTIRESLNK
jgi:2-dehydro-3-deoxyphosphogluconate aldolase/(4S)-4-hydroxy-2-oxoglutarate aldolase